MQSGASAMIDLPTVVQLTLDKPSRASTRLPIPIEYGDERYLYVTCRICDAIRSVSHNNVDYNSTIYLPKVRTT